MGGAPSLLTATASFIFKVVWLQRFFDISQSIPKKFFHNFWKECLMSRFLRKQIFYVKSVTTKLRLLEKQTLFRWVKQYVYMQSLVADNDMQAVKLNKQQIE